jgi:DNA mismatch endonuclease (patch repair protein)
MADVHNKETRSYNMSQIKDKDTKPEILVRKFLFAKGYRYKLYDKKLHGKPDLVFPKYKKVIFIHGCFWHGHEGCKYFVIPKTRTEWWINKINRTKEKDSLNVDTLENEGWKVKNIWECELNSHSRGSTLNKILEFIKSENSGN